MYTARHGFRLDRDRAHKAYFTLRVNKCSPAPLNKRDTGARRELLVLAHVTLGMDKYVW